MAVSSVRMWLYTNGAEALRPFRGSTADFWDILRLWFPRYVRMTPRRWNPFGVKLIIFEIFWHCGFRTEHVAIEKGHRIFEIIANWRSWRLTYIFQLHIRNSKCCDLQMARKLWNQFEIEFKIFETFSN